MSEEGALSAVRFLPVSSVRPVARVLLGAILMLTSAARSRGQHTPETGGEPTPRDPQAFRAAFDAAFDRGDKEAVAHLLRLNPTRFIPLFEGLARVWIERTEEVGEREQHALARARAIAEAADEALDAPGLLETLEALEGWSDADRVEWSAARRALSRGEGLDSSRRWQEATEVLAGPCEQLERLGDANGLARSLFHLGHCFDSLGHYEKAIDDHEQALALRGKLGNPQDIAASLDNLGGCYLSLGRYPKAIDDHERALALFEKIGDPQGMSNALNNLGICCYSLGQYPKAIDHHERALRLREEIGNPQAIAASLNNLGACHHRLGQYDKAIDHHRQALALREKIGNPQDIATSLDNLGICCSSLGRYEEAIDHHERALTLREKSGNQQEIASSLDNLGLDYASLGQYEKAIDRHERALALREKIGNRQDIAHSLENLGSCYNSLGQSERAIDFHERALPLFEAIGNLLELAYSLDNLGNCYHSLGQYQKAIDHHERALALKEKVGSPQDIAKSLNNLGACYHHLGQYDKAIDYDQRALELKEKIGNRRDIATSLDNLGNCAYSLGHYENAIDYFQRALELKEKIGNRQDIASSLDHLAGCLHALGQYEKTLSLFERCVAELEQLKLRRLPEASRAAFFGTWSDMPLLVSRTLFAMGPRGAAERMLARGFPLCDFFFARTLVEGLQERSEAVLAAGDPQLAAEHSHALDRMVELRLQLEREANKQTIDEDELARLQEELGARGADLEEIERRLRAKNPGLAEIVAPESASLADVKNALGPVEVLLWYVLGQQESFVWVITREGASIVKLPASVDIEARVKGLIGSLASGSKSLEFVPPARELYEMLLAKPLACCPEKGQLIIVPNGLLGFLPFEVLLGREVPQEERQRGRLPYLLREKTIRYAPSPSLFVFLHRHRRPEGGWAKDLLLFGDPVYAGEARATAAFANRASRSLLPESFSRLSKTRDEVKTLAESLVQDDESKLFLQLRDLKRSGCVSGKRFDLFVGEKASKSQLKGDLSRYRIVHLATHGYFDTRYPWFSGLVLSDVPDDLAGGFLSLSEIGELKLDADVVFLSACETAKGSLAHCEGILNTARYFLLAGARSVVATQWDVLDYAAPIVARVFYEHLFAGEAPGEALREAKLALIDERADIRGARSLGEGATNDAPSFSHPSVWAPFVIFGK